MSTENAHTPGPWFWNFNEDTKRLTLESQSNGLGRWHEYVMDLKRWGWNGATIRFRTPDHLMEPASNFSAIVPGREHHASWFKTLDHPDARLIAAAPDLLDAARTILEYLEWIQKEGCEEEMNKLRAAINKATQPVSWKK